METSRVIVKTDRSAPAFTYHPVAAHDVGQTLPYLTPTLRHFTMPDDHWQQFNNIDLVALQRFASCLAAIAPDRLVIGLSGTLGAGKTTLVQNLASAIGIDRGDVTSPTFTLLQSHRGHQLNLSPADHGPTTPSASPSRIAINLHHLDAYRIADLDAWDELGIDELIEQPGSWTVIEWAGKVSAALPPQTLWIEIQMQSGPFRDISVRGGPENMLSRLDDVVRQWLPR